MEIATILVALYGATLSTILAINEFRKERRVLRVTCDIAIAGLTTGGSYTFVAIKVVNVGHRPVTLTSAGFILNNGKWATQLESQMGMIPLPKKLEDGDNVSLMFDYDRVVKLAKEMGEGIRFTKAVVSDAAGKKYSAPIPTMLKNLELTT